MKVYSIAMLVGKYICHFVTAQLFYICSIEYFCSNVFPTIVADKNVASSEQAQPMYVNMHELANMAASKAQEMSFPPPPPEVTNVPPECQEKVS